MNNITYAAKALLDKMYKIYDSEEYKAVWSLSFAHGMPYQGETWEKEFEELKKAVELELKDKDSEEET